jgi:hypothetical protein
LFGIPGEKTEDHLAAARIYADLKYLNRIKCHNLTYYREAEIFDYAPAAVKNNQGYRADFFSAVSGSPEMLRANRTFQKYYKILPLLPAGINRFIARGRRWQIFNYIPSLFVFLLMLLLAIKNRDRRFLIYGKYYPRKLRRALGI